MLAVQRPSMGSSKPPNLEMPFGYSFDTTSNYPFPSPTAPAPGPSLLDDNESKFLDSFFDGVSSDHFNYDFLNNVPDRSEFGPGGWDELPPTFMGTTSSFGQQPQIPSQGMPGMNYEDMNSQMNAQNSIPPTTSADVLAAATLLQNGTNGRTLSMNDGLFRGQHVPMLQTNGQGRDQSMSHQTPSRPQARYQPPRTLGDDYMRDNFYTDMMFGSQPSESMQNRPSQKLDIRWGSDVGFNSPQGFVAPTNQDSIAVAERSHIQAIEAAFSIGQVPSSAETTRPPSPAPRNNNKLHLRTQSISHDADEEELDSERPRKRRKSKYPEEAVDEEEESPVSVTPKQTAVKKRKPVKQSANESPVTESEPGHKRRKSAAAAAAKARENLTEEQKRENHIKSEQKRRTLIREGFEDLGELVPGLRGGGFSKSAVLIMAADWLEDLIQGNEALRGRLDQMEGRSS